MSSKRNDILSNKFSSELLKEMNSDIYDLAKNLERLETAILNTEQTLYKRLSEKIDEIDKYAEQTLIGINEETSLLFKNEYKKSINNIVSEFEKRIKKTQSSGKKGFLRKYIIQISVMFFLSFLWALGGFYIGKYAAAINVKNDLEIIKTLDYSTFNSIKNNS